MDKVLKGQIGTEVLDGVFSVKKNVADSLVDLSCKKTTKPKTLSSHISYLNRANTYRTGISSICVGAVSINDDLSDKLTCKIVTELASAIDKNDVIKVKELKQQYQDKKEFVKAKDFLNKKCKEVWDVFENKTTLDIVFFSKFDSEFSPLNSEFLCFPYNAKKSERFSLKF